MKRTYHTNTGTIEVSTREIPGHEVRVVFRTSRGAITESLSLSKEKASALGGMLEAAAG